MFNKKLKEEIKELKKENQGLWNQLNDFSWKEQEAEAKITAYQADIKAKDLIIDELNQKIEELQGQNAFECGCVSERDEIINAQATILVAFSEYIINSNKKEKKPFLKLIKSLLPQEELVLNGLEN